MKTSNEAQKLGDVLEELCRCADEGGAKISVEGIREAVGRRSFGPILLLAGLLGMTPVAAVPTAPTMLAIITFLVAGQLLIGRDTFWLPRFLLRLEVAAPKLQKAVRLARKPTKVVDRVVKPRLRALTGPAADRVVAFACVILAGMTPPLELLPFVAFIPSAAVAMFGLSLVARDGVLVLLGLILASVALGFAGYQLWR